MDTITVLPFRVALIVGLAPQALPIYQINAWGAGTLKVEPWRAKLSPVIRCRVTAFIDQLKTLIRSAGGLPLLATATALVVVAWSSDTTAYPAMLGLTVVELRANRERLIRDAAAIVGPNNTFENDDRRSQFDRMMTEVDGLGRQVEDVDRAERVARLQRETLPETQRTGEHLNDDENREGRQRYERAIGQYIRGVSVIDMEPEIRDALRTGYHSFSGDERRQMSTLTGQAGGYVVAPDTRFYGVILQALKFFGGMQAAGAEVITTESGADLPMPMGDDTANTGTIVPEEGDHSGGTSPTLKQAVLRAFMYSSKTIKVSLQLLQDSAVDIESYLGGLLGERIGRIRNTHFTTGDGVNKPSGLFTTATVGRQAVVGNTTSIPFDDVFETIHSVDVAYRSPRARWQMHDKTALKLRIAKDGNGRYLWPEMGNVQGGHPLQLGGYGVVINNDVAQMAASAKVLSFGDHWYYKIRRVSGMSIVRLNEKFIENGQIGFLAFMRGDGGYANPGQDPVKLFQNSAT